MGIYRWVETRDSIDIEFTNDGHQLTLILLITTALWTFPVCLSFKEKMIIEMIVITDPISRETDPKCNSIFSPLPGFVTRILPSLFTSLLINYPLSYNIISKSL